jgi:DNA repair exonuclease SbcCD ATPase subunit
LGFVLEVAMSASKEIINYTVKGNEKIVWDPKQDWQAQFNSQLNAYLINPRKKSKDHESFALRLQNEARNPQTLIAALTTRQGLKVRGGWFGQGKPSWLHAFCVEALQQFHASQFQAIQTADKNKAKMEADYAKSLKAKEEEIDELKSLNGVNNSANAALEIARRNQAGTARREQDKLAGEIALLKTQLLETEAKVTTGQAEVQTHVSEKEQLQAQVSELTSNVADLSSKLRSAQDRADEAAQYKSALATTTEDLAKEKEKSAVLQENLTDANIERTALAETLSFVLNWVDKLFGNTFGWSPSKFLSQKQEPPIPENQVVEKAKEDKSSIFSRLAFWNQPEKSAAPSNDRTDALQLQS